LQVKRLELCGFKSFMNPVSLEFGGGITAILGPNGCGKSNVVDALRWVLGEQSAKQLRGEKMSNVVFGGTRTRKPLGMAEVSIGFTNLDGRMPTPYQEVRITRRLTRDGVSDYLLNGASCWRRPAGS
jgi:chromosome segregation protein